MALVQRETDYALRALARLAAEEDFVAVSALAEREDVPEKFLRKIMQGLQRAGLVESRQGSLGGYRLAVPAYQVTLLGVMETVQGPLVVNECFAQPEICQRVAHCPLRRRMEELQARVCRMLDEVCLSDLASETLSREGTAT